MAQLCRFLEVSFYTAGSERNLRMCIHRNDKLQVSQELTLVPVNRNTTKFKLLLPIYFVNGHHFWNEVMNFTPKHMRRKNWVSISKLCVIKHTHLHTHTNIINICITLVTKCCLKKKQFITYVHTRLMTSVMDNLTDFVHSSNFLR